jgi:hypothetical protein
MYMVVRVVNGKMDVIQMGFYSVLTAELCKDALDDKKGVVIMQYQ